MTPEELNSLNTNEVPGKSNQVDNFSRTTKLLERQLKDKKENIQKVLWNNELRKIFEELLSSDSENRRKCIDELKQCENNEEKIKKVILANLPEWYAYNVSSDKVINVEIEKGDYDKALLKDQKEEVAKQEIQTAEQKKETAEKDTQTAEKDTQTVEQKKETAEQIEKMKQAIEVRDQLVNKYKSKDLTRDLDTITNENSENYQIIKQQLENNWTLNQLRQTHDEQFINDYILVQTTLQELKSNPTNYEPSDISYFDKIVKNLDNACNIPDTNLNSFSSKNITRTRHELFNSDIWNQDLIESKKSNLKSRDYTDLFPDKSEKELINEYGKFLDNEQIKSLIIKYNNNENLTDEEKNYLITGCKNAKNQIDNKTKDMVEELCLISQIKWMYMCMWKWSDFQLNKSNEIESKDWMLTLRGHIDWIAFSIRQDTNKPEARLQTSTRLRKKDNAFVIWDNFEDSNFILPSQSEVFNLAVKSVNSDWALQDAESPADYVSKLQDKIMSKMDNMYEDTKYANHYMHEQVKWEQIMDKSLALVKNLKKSEIPTPITESNKGLFDFVGLIHFNIKNSTSLEKDRMNSCLEKIQNLVNEYQDTDKVPESWKYPLIIEHYLTDKAILKNTKTLLEWWVVEGESMFDLFGKYIDKSDQRSDWKFWMINLAFLENDLIPRKEGRSLIAENYAEITLKKEWGYADMYLDNQLMWISETPAFA